MSVGSLVCLEQSCSLDGLVWTDHLEGFSDRAWIFPSDSKQDWIWTMGRNQDASGVRIEIVEGRIAHFRVHLHNRLGVHLSLGPAIFLSPVSDHLKRVVVPVEVCPHRCQSSYNAPVTLDQAGFNTRFRCQLFSLFNR